MKKEYYIEDKNGAYFSEDGKKRWTKLTGRDLYEFFQTERGKKACFYEYVNEKGVLVGFEVCDAESASEIRVSKRHTQYVNDINAQYKYTVVPYDYIVTKDGESCGDEVIPDEDNDFLEEIAHNADICKLQQALRSLSDDEYELINSLYLSENRMSVRAYAKCLKVSHTAIIKRKNEIFEKIRKYF